LRKARGREWNDCGATSQDGLNKTDHHDR